MNLTERQKAIAAAIEQIAREKLTSLPAAEQEAVQRTRNQIDELVRAAGDAGEVAFILSQIGFTSVGHRPYNGLFDDLGQKAIQRAMILDPEAFLAQR